MNTQLGLQGCRKHTWPEKSGEKDNAELMNEL
jgi:hypothetical protein